MKTIGTLLLKYWQLTAAFIMLYVIYIVQNLVTVPTDAVLKKYGISLQQLHALLLTVAIPLVIVWTCSLLGFLCLYGYQKSLKGGKDAVGFRWLAFGLFFMILWLPLTSVISGAFSGYYGNHHEVTAVLTRIDVYVNLIVLLPAFYFVYKGSEKLLGATRLRRRGMTDIQTAVFIAFGAFYTYLMLHDPHRTIPGGSSHLATYYLSDWLIVATVVIPRLIMWYWGMQALINIGLYRRKVEGTIYRQALKHLAYGLGGVFFVTILLRVLQTGSDALNKLSLGGILLLLYLLVFMLGVGYILIAKGARQLQKIEES